MDRKWPSSRVASSWSLHGPQGRHYLSNYWTLEQMAAFWSPIGPPSGHPASNLWTGHIVDKKWRLPGSKWNHTDATFVPTISSFPHYYRDKYSKKDQNSSNYINLL